jgi:hypothetical protein
LLAACFLADPHCLARRSAATTRQALTLQKPKRHALRQLKFRDTIQKQALQQIKSLVQIDRASQSKNVGHTLFACGDLPHCRAIWASLLQAQ